MVYPPLQPPLWAEFACYSINIISNKHLVPSNPNITLNASRFNFTDRVILTTLPVNINSKFAVIMVYHCFHLPILTVKHHGTYLCDVAHRL